MKSNRTRSVASALLLLCATSSAFALGFGRARTVALMGQSLEFSVPVRLETGEDLTPDCLGIEVYYGDSRLSAAVVDHVIEAGAAPNERLVRVRVEQPIDEPVVTVYVAAGCSGRVTRKFVAFADPPTAQVAENTAARSVPVRPQAVAVPVVVAPVAAASAVPVLPAREAPAARRRPVAAATGASAVAVPAEAAVVRPTATARLPKGPRAAPERPLTPQLKLDLIDAEARTLPNLKLALDPLASAPDDGQNPERRAAAAALWRALNASPEDLLRDQQRLATLESQLARMQAESGRTRELLESVESRLQNAEAQRHDNPLVWGLAGLSALLGAAVGGLLWQRRRERRQARWWNADQAPIEPGEAAAVAPPAPEPPAAVVLPSPAPVPAAPAGFTSHTVPAELPAPAPPAAAPVSVSLPPAAAPVAVSAAATAPRQVSVEELIDLEQQAEFFVVLGQDEAAIDLLQAHLRSDAHSSPLPYLKLLEIHRRRDEKDAYEQVRAQFNSQFNAWAPDWDQDLGRGRALEDYPGVLERLILIWPSPVQALEVLQASLLRPDGVDANTFDLPAYRELLFLYAVVRDLVERGEVDAPGGIDLLLDDEPPAGRVESPPVAHVVEPVLPLVALEIEPSGSPLEVERPPVDESDAHLIDFEHIDLQPASPKDKA